MERKTARDFHPEVLRWFDLYVHGQVDRRGFLNGVAKYAVGGVTAMILLESLQPKFAEAQQVPKDDARIKAKFVEFPSPEGYGKVRAYLVAIIMINPHIEDITRRLALDNFIALAPDELSSLGGYPGDEEKAVALFAQLDQTKCRADFVAAANYLKTLPECTGRIGVVGFCYGGGIANMLATRLPDLGAAVPFYGAQPSAEDTAKIKAPLLIHYAENDPRIDAGWPAYETALKGAGVKYQMFQYPGTQHGFNNDTTPRYDAAAAKLAWSRTIEFFNRNLRQA